MDIVLGKHIWSFLQYEMGWGIETSSLGTIEVVGPGCLNGNCFEEMCTKIGRWWQI